MTRAWRLALCFVATACAGRKPMAPVGVSTGGAVTGDRGPLRAPTAPSPLPVDFRATLAKVGARRFAAGGHAGGRFDADIYVTPSAKDKAFAPVGTIEPGTILVMDEIVHGAASGGPVLMMEKKPPGFDPAHGDWRYVVVDGKAVEDGPLAPCAGCHDEAPHDHVFSVE